MRLKKYKNLPLCKPVRIPYSEKIEHIMELFDVLHSYEKGDNILDKFTIFLEDKIKEKGDYEPESHKTTKNNSNVIKNKHSQSVKGQQGFVKKYQSLGESKLMRVPLSVFDKIKMIITLLEDIGRKKELDAVYKILDKIIVGIEDV